MTIIQSHDPNITAEINGNRTMPWLFTAVYASPHQQAREQFWEEIQQFGATVRRPLLLARDINDTISLEEWNHWGADMIRRCAKFKIWIENNGLIDLRFSGPK